MSIFVRFYLDWIFQLFDCVMYLIILFTPAIFFIGVCLYIAEMVDDFGTSMSKLNEAKRKLTGQQFTEQILFHQKLFG